MACDKFKRSTISVSSSPASMETANTPESDVESWLLGEQNMKKRRRRRRLKNMFFVNPVRQPLGRDCTSTSGLGDDERDRQPSEPQSELGDTLALDICPDAPDTLMDSIGDVWDGLECNSQVNCDGVMEHKNGEIPIDRVSRVPEAIVPSTSSSSVARKSLHPNPVAIATVKKETPKDVATQPKDRLLN